MPYISSLDFIIFFRQHKHRDSYVISDISVVSGKLGRGL
ncbi:hypothetical protein CP10743SC13_0438 [Chlamydia psittaci 10_743_SC13]|nr:hypothetical protein CP10743SC13_0438 [Chlamydia psittaci 10_743_SC13]